MMTIASTPKAPAGCHIHVRQEIRRECDNLLLGEVSNPAPLIVKAIRYKDRARLRHETALHQTIEEAIAWVAANPHVPEVLPGDPDFILVGGEPGQVVKRVAGGGIIARRNRSVVERLYAYRHGVLWGTIEEAPSGGWHLRTRQKEFTLELVGSYLDAVEALADASLGDDHTGHQAILRAAQRRAETIGT
jgi:hypothetical protein